MSYYKHLNYEDRQYIEIEITKGTKKSDIAEALGKDKTTIAKEIKNNRYIKTKSNLLRECNNYKHCKYKRNCTSDCEDFIQFKCIRRDRSPGSCNGCSSRNKCRFDKYHYSAIRADNNYKLTLVDSRVGINLTTDEAAEIGYKLKDGFSKGHSIYQILQYSPEIDLCEKTIYNYIEQNVFSCVGITNMDLRRKVSRTMTKQKQATYKKRKTNAHIINRTYDLFIEYAESSEVPVKIIEMDTVYNEQQGPYMQTFFINELKMIIAIYHEENTSLAMVKGFYQLVDYLGGIDHFKKVCDCIITDRGSEFSKPELIETNQHGVHMCKLFYANAMASHQKAKVERKHVELRKILPKKHNLTSLGLTSQEVLNKVISHVNSEVLESLNHKSPFQVAKFFYPEIVENLHKKTSLRYKLKM